MENIFYFKNIPIRYKINIKNSKYIILLHGFLENLNVFDDLFSNLSENYSVLSIDLLGHGKSGFLNEIHTMEIQAQMLNSLFYFLNIKEYVIIGHSMGGYIINTLLNNNLENIKGVCFLNSHTFCDDENTTRKRLEMIDLLNRGLKDKIINFSIPNIFHIKNEQHISKLKEIAKMCNEQGIINCILGMKERIDTTNIFINYNCKKLFIQGKYDNTLNVLKTKEKLFSIKNINFVEMETGHISFLENYSQTITLINNFINEI